MLHARLFYRVEIVAHAVAERRGEARRAEGVRLEPRRLPGVASTALLGHIIFKLLNKSLHDLNATLAAIVSWKLGRKLSA